MSQIHIKLPKDSHQKLRKIAKERNFSIQEFAEKAINFAVSEPDALFSA